MTFIETVLDISLSDFWGLQSAAIFKDFKTTDDSLLPVLHSTHPVVLNNWKYRTFPPPFRCHAYSTPLQCWLTPNSRIQSKLTTNVQLFKV